MIGNSPMEASIRIEPRTEQPPLPQALVRERLSGAGFEIVFEFARPALVVERAIGDQFPGFVTCRMHRLAFVVRDDAGFEIGCIPDIAPVGMRFATKQVDVKQAAVS
jgi:hypothetical protein